MSKYRVRPLDLSGLKTIPIATRGGKVQTADFGVPYAKGSGVAGWLGSLPKILAGDSFRAAVAALIRARQAGKPIIWGMGGHVIKCGLAPVLADLTHRGFATAFAMNGSASIHDFEIAIAGQTSEDVEAVLPEVFLKAVSAVRNLGAPLADFTTVNLDFLQHYRPRLNVVERPHAKAGGRGIALTGHHELMVPLLAAALIECG